MEAFELYNENQKPTGVWCCGKCRKLVLSPQWTTDSKAERSTREAAEACCRPPVCETCQQEYTPIFAVSGHGECEKCSDSRYQKKAWDLYQKRLKNAEDVTSTYDGPIYAENRNDGDMQDGYFSEVGILLDYAEDGEEEDGGLPEWVFACWSRIEKMDIGTILENLCYDGYEDMETYVVVPDSLEKAIAEFNADNEKALTVWEVDYKRKIRVKTEKKGGA